MNANVLFLDGKVRRIVEARQEAGGNVVLIDTLGKRHDAAKVLSFKAVA